jgi:hypothetical protein
MAWKNQQPQQQQQQVMTAVRATSDGHPWHLAAYLLINGIVGPALLAQPYVFAVLGWAGGIMTNLVMAVASWYCE